MDSPAYIDLSASDLSLTVLTGDVDASQFSVLETDRISHGDISVEARVIGASHFISFDIAGIKVHEIFSCAKVKAACAMAFYGPIKEVSGALDLVFFDNISYAFTPRLAKTGVEDPELEQIERRALDAEGQAGRIGLVYQFPDGGGGQPPKTIIVLDMDETGASASTIHSYPNEGNVVITHSRIGIKRSLTE